MSGSSVARCFELTFGGLDGRKQSRYQEEWKGTLPHRLEFPAPGQWRAEVESVVTVDHPLASWHETLAQNLKITVVLLICFLSFMCTGKNKKKYSYTC